jgi:hypothetical protein
LYSDGSKLLRDCSSSIRLSTSSVSIHLFIISISNASLCKILHAKYTSKCIYGVLTFPYKDFAEKFFCDCSEAENCLGKLKVNMLRRLKLRVLIGVSERVFYPLEQGLTIK